jgi:hypothetical protein
MPIARRPLCLIYHRDKQGNAFWLRTATLIGPVFFVQTGLFGSVRFLQQGFSGLGDFLGEFPFIR